MNPRRKSMLVSIILCIGFVSVVWAAFFLSAVPVGRAEVHHAHGTNNLLRLHVIAHSDRPTDQQMKLEVRDALLSELARIGPIMSREHLEESLRTHESALIERAKGVLVREGSDLPVGIEIGPAYFPERRLGSSVFPSGTYHAVRVIIGEGKGENWWCVLFPPLCFVEKDGIAVPIHLGEEENSDRTAGVSPGADHISNELAGFRGADESYVQSDSDGRTASDGRTKIRFELKLWNTIAQSSYADRMRAWFQIAVKDE